MRKYTAALAIVGLVAFSFFAFAARAQNIPTERIDNFSSNILLEQRGGLRITETIVYNFGAEEHHGIYRDIPLEYNSGENSISISNVTVADENGVPYTFDIFKENDFKRIKIGDPNELVSGSKTYVISYLVDGAVQWGDISDRVIWNATGDGWLVPILQASVNFDLSADINSENIEYECYQGSYGSTEPCNRSLDATSKIGFISSGFIDSGEGMTLSITLPKGVLLPPTPSELFWKTVLAYLPLLLPVAVFIFLFRRWQKYGRDPKGRGTIIPQYEPPDGMSPIEIGALSSGTIKSSYISAQIIYLATRGFLKISPVGDDSDKPKDYILEKLKNVTDGDFSPDGLLMKSLFSSGSSVKLSELKDKFVKDMSKIKGAVFQELVQGGFYDRDPQKVFGLYLLFAFLIFFFAFFAFGFSPIFAVGCILSSLLIGIFGWIMPRVTSKGAIEKENILGFKDYLNIAEKDRLNFHNAPEKRPELFEEFLPYALALGVADAWAKEFKDIYTESPKWYGGSGHGPFLAAAIANDMSNFSSVATSTAFAAGSSGSGGGGFSGGGAGGGGGGSW